jgi:hypothetical protein
LKVRTVTAVTGLCAQPKAGEQGWLKRLNRASDAALPEHKTFAFGNAAPTIDKACLPHENRRFNRLRGRSPW